MPGYALALPVGISVLSASMRNKMEDNPMHSVVCIRCHQALREVGEVCLGDLLQGVLEF
jgi:hypothetical protein